MRPMRISVCGAPGLSTKMTDRFSICTMGGNAGAAPAVPRHAPNAASSFVFICANGHVADHDKEGIRRLEVLRVELTQVLDAQRADGRLIADGRCHRTDDRSDRASG